MQVPFVTVTSLDRKLRNISASYNFERKENRTLKRMLPVSCTCIIFKTSGKKALPLSILLGFNKYGKGVRGPEVLGCSLHVFSLVLLCCPSEVGGPGQLWVMKSCGWPC